MAPGYAAKRRCARALRKGPAASWRAGPRVPWAATSERQLDDLGARRRALDREPIARRRLPAHERQRDRPEARRDDHGAEPADGLLAELQLRAGRLGRAQPQAAQVAVRLAAVVQARDGLLADVAALAERHGALVEPGLLRDDRLVEVDAVARAPGLDAQHLGRRLGHGHGAGRLELRPHAGAVPGCADHVDAEI